MKLTFKGGNAMSWYYGTYSCGHEGRVNIIGPSKSRQWKADRNFENLCPECYKEQLEKARNKKNEEAAEKSKEMELPELEGSDRQVAWANTLRIKVIEELEELIERHKKQEYPITVFIRGDNDYTSISVGEFADALDFMLREKTEAKFWIDNRDRNDYKDLCMYLYRKHALQMQDGGTGSETEEQEEQLTVVPDTEVRKSGIVELEYKHGASFLSVKYIKDSELISIVKDLNYRWNGAAWVKEITEYTGPIDARASELGNKLMLSGYTVKFPDVKSRDNAISGGFIPENDRWVKYNLIYGKLAISWRRKDEEIYQYVQKLPDVKWDDGSWLVNIEFYREVQDFAGIMGFSISQKAREEIEKYMATEDGFLHESVKDAGDNGKPGVEGLKRTLESGGTIIEDLRDD